MNCPNCGEFLSEEQLYCEKCGAEIHFVPDFEPEIEQSISETLSELQFMDEEGDFEDVEFIEEEIIEEEYIEEEILDENFCKSRVLAADIIDKGIVLTGGGALVDGFAQVLSQELKVPVFTAESPLTCVAEGTGILLDNLYMLERQ